MEFCPEGIVWIPAFARMTWEEMLTVAADAMGALSE